MRFVYLPLDTRPCNYHFPVQLARLRGVELAVPPMNLMSHFIKPSNFEGIVDWLFENCRREENSGKGVTLILSVDHLAFGSLLASRNLVVSKEECVKRLEVLRRLKEKFPALSIYAFVVLMRSSISTLCSSDRRAWELVNEYSELMHLSSLAATPEQDKEKIHQRLQAVKSELPEETLNTFLTARERNHLINRLCAELVQEGLLRDLCIVQEDSSSFGMHKTEQEVLLQYIKGNGLEDQIRIHNGTDEAGCLSVGKAIKEEQGYELSLSYLYLNDIRESFIASYEDRLFHENLLSHCKTAGIQLYDNSPEPENVLILYTPKTKQYEASLGNGSPPCDYTEAELEAFAELVSQKILEGKRVFLLDVAYANGGQGDILYRIHRRTPIYGLCGYSAWNTASNALGTIVAQIVLSEGRTIEDRANKQFLIERIMDDYVYQGIIRQKLRDQLNEQGQDPYHLSDQAKAEEILSREMSQFLQEDPMLSPYAKGTKISLPWPRIFEAEIQMLN